ncbi:hypothetical protein MJG53_017931 [Ovis ammon polii x Ovis aries]|uniref:Uncharacterized protein n=2 Tax=Ovis TaxID=9935 RepID=A0AAD4TNR3_OVIAM|nr:hypothetical protein MG293_018057 [Ovis ammon polii]KAI4551379.1 hypothetical protein MJT46_017631 [Ovis ammon polii x Ovis aries]KAI4559405.1 hypothetical protein MJG53_017931 [Ovis ammon polii x Ovis aries]
MPRGRQVRHPQPASRWQTHQLPCPEWQHAVDQQALKIWTQALFRRHLQHLFGFTLFVCLIPRLLPGLREHISGLGIGLLPGPAAPLPILCVLLLLLLGVDLQQVLLQAAGDLAAHVLDEDAVVSGHCDQS